MGMMGLVIAILVTLFASFSWAASPVLTSVKREIDLTQCIVRQTMEIEMKPNGADAFLFTIPLANVTKVAKLAAKSGEKLMEMTKLDPSAYPNRPDVQYYSFKLPAGDAAADTVSIRLLLVLIDAFVNFPAQMVNQNDPHLVHYFDNLYLLSPYVIEKLITTIKLPTARVESYSDHPNAKLTKDQLVYGPLKSVPAYSYQLILVHVRHSAPFVMAVNVKRTLQLSQWGYMSVEEEYIVRNSGPKFIGGFSRVDYEKSKPATAITTLPAIIPAGAFDIYFRDSIGNISTSKVKSLSSKQLQVDLTQRYPLLGGWQSTFHWGYNIDLATVLTSTGSRHKLTYPFAPHLKAIYSRDVEVEVRLPEGARNIEVWVGKNKSPQYSRRSVITNLDLFGRPAIVINSNNIVNPDHGEQLVVMYDFAVTEMLMEPIMLMVGFLSLFVVHMAYLRLP